MGADEVSGLVTDGVLTILKVALPMLSIGLIVGLIISILQATTQVNEQTIVFVSKILAVFISLIVFGQWMLAQLQDFTLRVFDRIVGG
ncbi:MAG: flagellar biosynthesis protein FliQ [Oscillospiraceae bacterium]|nr:flagellar biosynthesis protein FliQ [Oscillospiraceae bacterium]